MSAAARPEASAPPAAAAPALGALRATRRALAVGAWVSAALWGAAVTTTIVLLVLLAPAGLVDGRGAQWLALLALAAGAATAAVRLRRGARPSLVSAALWVEAREPALRYALVTVADRAERGEAAPEELARAAFPGRWPRLARGAAARAIAVPLAVLLCALLATAAAAVRLTAPEPDISASGAGDAAAGPGAAAAAVSELAPLTALVQPPAYTGLPARTLDDPSTITAIAGSIVTLRGRGAGRPVTVSVGGAAAARADWDGDRWSARVAVPARTTALRLADGLGARVVVLESVRDSAPAVTLTLPARDTVLREATGAFALAADASDDFGLASAQFEYIVSAGEGESFTFRSGTLGAARPGGRRAHLEARLSLDSLGLKPGDIVHLRATARDANAVDGPSSGASETRTLRVMRAGEADSVAVDAAPPAEADKSMVSQRMLITLTEALERRRPRLARAALLDESHRISVEQTRLRKAVGEIVFARLGGQPSGEESSGDDTRPRSPDAVLRAAEASTTAGGGATDFEGDETPVVAVNKPLLEAYNAMWDAGRSLDAGETARALPPMRVALAAIQRARNAERIYLRGRPPAVVVDVGRARLQGKDRGAGSARLPRAAADPAAARRAERFARAAASLGSAPAAAVDSLMLLRVDLLDARPRAAAALGDAIERLRRGADATEALARARRLVDGDSAPPTALGGWGRAW